MRSLLQRGRPRVCSPQPSRGRSSRASPPAGLLDTQMGMIASKRCLTTAPVLRTFDSSRRSVVTADASEVAISAVLTQPDDDAAAHESRKLTAAEQAYPPHVLELMAVIPALRAFRHYLLGSDAPRPLGCFRTFAPDRQPGGLVSAHEAGHEPLPRAPARRDRGVPLRRGARPGPP